MKRIVLLLTIFIAGFSNYGWPVYKSFELINKNEFSICFDRVFDPHPSLNNLMYALEIKNTDGSSIDRKWHDEYVLMLDGSLDNDKKCYQSNYNSYFDAGNSTPKEIQVAMNKLDNNKIKEITLSISSSKYNELGSTVSDMELLKKSFIVVNGKVEN